MANEIQLDLLIEGVKGWNDWRKENLKALIDLSGANLTRADLGRADLSGADLSFANLKEANLRQANLRRADVHIANLSYAKLNGADLTEAVLDRTILEKGDLSGANLSYAKLNGVNFYAAKLHRANLSYAKLNHADLSGADLYRANLSYAKLNHANLQVANLRSAKLNGADLGEAILEGTILEEADLSGADLREANLTGANLSGADLREANLTGANLTGADLGGADLRGANLREANLTNSHLVRAKVSNANISKSNIYGVNVWGLEGEFIEQKELIITPNDESVVTVDNIRVAQFVYLILNNKEIRDVINTLTSKTVLILGRFAPPERKAILDALRNKLREYDLLPIVFDFDRPADKDFTETVKTLAGISYFVIADVTNPKSSPLELQATIPDYQIPFVPIIQEGEYPFAMMVDLQKKYNWVLDTISYDSLDTLIEILKPHIIDPAIKKRDELRIIKAAEPTIISGRELRNKMGKS